MVRSESAALVFPNVPDQGFWTQRVTAGPSTLSLPSLGEGLKGSDQGRAGVPVSGPGLHLVTGVVWRM